MTLAHSYRESFDSSAVAPSQPHPEYLRGKRDAEAANANDAARQLEELIAVFNDLKFSFAEARGTLLADLQPVFQAILDKLIPEMRNSALANEVLVQLQNIVSSTLPTEISVHLCPEDFAFLTSRIDFGAEQGVQFIENPEFSPGTAWIDTAVSNSMIDLNAVFSEIANSLAALTAQKSERKVIQNG